MVSNANLQAAATARKDEFWTQLVDIEKELVHYKHHFRGRIVYCNCDDPTVSNFFHYFSYNFDHLGLKKLITTCYRNRQRDLFLTHEDERAIKLEYDGFREGERVPDIEDIGVTHLEGDGDFRSPECIEILKQADIVVTNPPFSLFREYVAQLVDYDKYFLILGDQNAITYKEIFPLIKEERLWLGFNNGGTKWFEVNPEYDIGTESRKKVENGRKYFSMGRINWFTNLDHSRRREELILYKRYTPEEYPTYDNYDAIEVSRTENIPMDYDGAMGVPITFLDKHNPDQFEMLGATESEGRGFSGGLWRQEIGTPQALIRGRRVFKRLFIRNRNPGA